MSSQSWQNEHECAHGANKPRTVVKAGDIASCVSGRGGVAPLPWQPVIVT